ncbi:MAG: carbohydrate porin [Planctomycetota bacterium]|jgi:hypothetical protein
MHRHVSATILALLAVGLAFAAPATAGEDDDTLREEVRQLRERVEALQAQGSTALEREIEEYLDTSSAWRGAQGDASMDRITIHARFTVVNQNTLGLDPADRSVVNGDVDLDFDFQVGDNLDLFIHLTANAASGAGNAGFPSQFGPVTTPGGSFGPIAGPTLAGLTDGIGVNGVVSTKPGSIRVYEAGIHHVLKIANTTVDWELGAIDPRTRFLQNAFADDENKQFIHNSFDDTAAIMWVSDATGRTVFGFHAWLDFGDNKQIRLNFGWFNAPGQWFNNGQFLIQGRWKGDILDREMNVYLMFFINEFFQDATGDGDWGGGASWDWMVTDKIGVFARLVANSGDANPVSGDFSFGAVITGPLGSRPDDTLGVAVGIIETNDEGIRSFTGNPLEFFPQSTEITVEVYYRYMMEEGKLQITPHLIIVSDPGGGRSPWQDDLLFILGIRIFVPF